MEKSEFGSEDLPPCEEGFDGERGKEEERQELSDEVTSASQWGGGGGMHR